jgi:hypothetical protein
MTGLINAAYASSLYAEQVLSMYGLTTALSHVCVLNLSLNVTTLRICGTLSHRLEFMKAPIRAL